MPTATLETPSGNKERGRDSSTLSEIKEIVEIRSTYHEGFSYIQFQMRNK